MFKGMFFVVIVVAKLAGGTSILLAQVPIPIPAKNVDRQPQTYEAEDEIPKDEKAEQRRDYSILEAALNDLASPKNPEYKYQIQNVGPGREILVGYRMCTKTDVFDLRKKSRNVDGTDTRIIPDPIREDFNRRSRKDAGSLKDFKPAYPNILVRDLDKEFKDNDDFVDAFLKKYPTAWGYVWAYPPGYSVDGQTAIVVFEGGPNGDHGLNWVYKLNRKGKVWEVEWRHCRPRE